MKPREFWIGEVGFLDIHQASSVPPQNESWAEQRFIIHVREVVPIDWKKVWEQYDGIERFDHLEIQNLIEKQLAGEE